MTENDPSDLTEIHGLSWEAWSAKLEDHHEHLRTIEGFEGYGPRPIMADTGDACWRQYWLDGYSPEDALSEDRTYWED